MDLRSGQEKPCRLQHGTDTGSGTARTTPGDLTCARPRALRLSQKEQKQNQQKKIFEKIMVGDFPNVINQKHPPVVPSSVANLKQDTYKENHIEACHS